MPLALPPPSGPVFAAGPAEFARGIAASRASQRRRMVLPLHRRQDAPVQRLLNFLQPGTYIRPHLHPLPGASETVQVLQGAIGFLTFAHDGRPATPLTLLPPPAPGLVDIEPGIWHTMVALAPDTVLLELKRGPYDPATDKSFAPWAPEEGSPGCPPYLADLASYFPC